MYRKADLIHSFLENCKDVKNGMVISNNFNDEKFIPYKKFYLNSLKYISKFRDNNIKEGDEIIFESKDIEKYISVFFACQLKKITFIPLGIVENSESYKRTINVWRMLKKPYLITDEGNYKQIVTNEYENKDLINDISKRYVNLDVSNYSEDYFEYRDDNYYRGEENDFISFIQFSSGTTGVPKGVPILYSQICDHVHAVSERQEITKDDVILNWLSFTHNFALINVFLVGVYRNAKMYLMSKDMFVENPTSWLDKTNKYKATRLYSPNFGYQYLLKCKEKFKDWDLSSVKTILNGAEPISYKLCTEFLESMKKYNLSLEAMYPGYGCAEATCVVTLPSVGEKIRYYKINREKMTLGDKVEFTDDDNFAIELVSVGHAISSCELRICDENNRELDDFYIGNIQIRGSGVVKGYYNSSDNSSFLEDGWFNTGDLGFMDKENLIIAGRSKELIVVNGQNYYPYDIERVIEENVPLVKGRIAVFGGFSEKLQTDEVCVFVKYEKDFSDNKFLDIVDKIEKSVYRKIGLYISEIIPLEKFERTYSGKLRRFKMFENYRTGQYDCFINKIRKLRQMKIPKKNTETKVEKVITILWAEALEIKKIGLDDNFFDLGGNSKLVTIIMREIQNIYGNKILITDIFQAPTIRKLTKLIETKINSKNTRYICSNSFNDGFIKDVQSKSKALRKISEDISKYEYLISNKDKKTLFLSIYISVISQIIRTEKTNIEILLNDMKQMNSISINVDDFSELDDLFNEVKSKISSNINLFDVDKVVCNDRNNKIVIVYSMDGYVYFDDKDIDIYIWISDKDNTINFKISESRIDFDAISEVIDKFMYALEIVNDDFESDVSEVENE